MLILILIITAIIIFLVYQYKNKNKDQIQSVTEAEQMALVEKEIKKNEIVLKELKIKTIQEIITNINANESIITQINTPDLTNDDILKILTDNYPECENEIRSYILNNKNNADEMTQCFIDITNKKILLIGNEECIIKLNGVGVTINNINLKEIDIQEIVKCIENKRLQKITEEHAVTAVNEIAQNIFNNSKTENNYINNEYTTTSGIKYKVGALQQTDAIFNNGVMQRTATKCGTSQGVISVGYDITITHPDNVNETTICVFGDGVINGETVNQMDRHSDNTWYMYINDKNQCIDWGIYIPHDGNSSALSELEQTNKFKFYKAYDESQGINVKDIDNNVKYTVYYTQGYCENVNQKRYVTWYYWDKNTRSCKEYIDRNYGYNESDTDSVQFIKVDTHGNTNKVKNDSKINLYIDQSTCSSDNITYETYKYNINTNSCTNRNSIKSSKEISQLNAGVDPIKNVENIYYGSNCWTRIKQKYYRYDFDETTHKNKCIMLITDKCNNYGDPNLCNFEELNNWINETNFDRGKIYPDGGLEECKKKYEQDTLYIFNVAENKCDQKMLNKGEWREGSDISGIKYYQTDDECEKNNIKYLTFNINGCHEPDTRSRTFNEIEGLAGWGILSDKKKNGENIQYNPHVKIPDSNSGKYGISNTTQIWDNNGQLIPKYTKDYYGAIDVCRRKADNLWRQLQ